ncbi:MAG: hypothetical protein DKM50_04295 [Candidatus Margulisiibacteriota bacterium]|nr:MAG: hypothetical protein DKM50_04295 [Candidatus Margulisiibacteriota bacterium]
MPKVYDIDKEENKKEIITILQKAVQSAHLNFLIGAGCSYPAIQILGSIEQEVQAKIDGGDNNGAELQIFNFLKPFLVATTKLKCTSTSCIDTQKTISNYKSFLWNISQILFERKSNIIPKQATIFSTNYDMFVEKAHEDNRLPIKLNDGFSRNPTLNETFRFSSSEFFSFIHNIGNLYHYEVKKPSINLIKLHGSLSWKSIANEIIFSLADAEAILEQHEKMDLFDLFEPTPEDFIEIEKFNQNFSLIFPKKDKFKDTLLKQVHYDLLRLYANELDKENTLLIAEGFSFADEHIFEITKRALKNPTLKLIIFCYGKAELNSYQTKFSSFNNVDILYSETINIDFSVFNDLMTELLPLTVNRTMEAVLNE